MTAGAVFQMVSIIFPYDIYHAECTVNKLLMIDKRKCPKHVEFHAKNKFVKSVHLVGFIIKKCVTMHGNMNVKFVNIKLENVLPDTILARLHLLPTAFQLSILYSSEQHKAEGRMISPPALRVRR
jgi:hypothetical protein